MGALATHGLGRGTGPLTPLGHYLHRDTGTVILWAGGTRAQDRDPVLGAHGHRTVTRCWEREPEPLLRWHLPALHSG